MSRTIEAIMRHMTLPSNKVTNQPNGPEKLEREFTVRKRHYVWSEARFVRAMMPFHSNVRVSYDGKEVNGKNVLDLMTLAAPEGSTVHCRRVRRCRGNARTRATMHRNLGESNQH